MREASRYVVTTPTAASFLGLGHGLELEVVQHELLRHFLAMRAHLAVNRGATQRE